MIVLPAETPVLRGPRVVLRAPDVRDVDAIRRLGVDPEIERLFGQHAEARRELSQAEAEAFYLAQIRDSNPLRWVLEFEGAFVGTARLHSVEKTDRRAAFAIGILSRDHLGRGLGTEATCLVLEHAFEILGLHRVSVRVLSFNERALACYRRCGFVEEGRERESAFFEGGWYDDVIMGVLADEYRRPAASSGGAPPSADAPPAPRDA
jgi:[ribosomal protein S5]-alanine N-acetyltransferase